MRTCRGKIREDDGTVPGLTKAWRQTLNTVRILENSRFSLFFISSNMVAFNLALLKLGVICFELNGIELIWRGRNG